MTVYELIGRFIDDCCTIDAGATVPTPDLYRAFCDWWPADPPTPSARLFARRLHALGFVSGKRTKNNGPRLRNGLRLKGDDSRAVVDFPRPAPAPPTTTDDPPDPSTPEPPSSLSDGAARWWREVNADFELSTHQRMILTLAAQTWDRAQRLDAAIQADGEVFKKANGDWAPRPEVAAYAKATSEFRQLVRELGFDLESAHDHRPPRVATAKAKR